MATSKKKAAAPAAKTGAKAAKGASARKAQSTKKAPAKKETAKKPSSKKAASGVSGTYSADDMRELSGLEPIRQSPGQYIGETDAISAVNGKDDPKEGETLTAGGLHLFVETCGNASDEATNAGADGKTYADRILITLHADQSITVQDNGRGVPPDVNRLTGKTGIEMAYLTMNAGGKFKDRNEKKAGNYKTAQGLHGVGAACVAALSDRLDVTVWRDGREYTLSAKQGVPGEFAGDEVRAKFTPFKGKGSAVKNGKDSRKAKDKKGMETGTRVHWHPDPLIWGGTDIPIRDIYEYVEAQSYMAPAATYVIRDETGIGLSGHLGKCGTVDKDGVRTSEFHKPGGIDDMINEKTSKTSNISGVISFDVPTSYTKTVTTEDENGAMGKKDIDYDCDVKFSLRWTSATGEDVEGYANGVHCVGRHVEGFRRGMSRALSDWIKKSGIMTKKDEKDGISPNMDDITEGLVACIEVLLEDQCAFKGQTKDELTNAEVLSCVSNAVKEQMGAWLSAKKNATQAKRIAKSVLDNARLRYKQKKEKENAKKIKEKLGGLTSKPANLLDCRLSGPGTEIICCEGKSAGGTIKMCRQNTHQALLQFRGVTVNCYDAKPAKILANAELSDLISAMGAKGIGNDFDYENRRYDRIGIYTDADEDGNYIRSLLLVFIYKCFPGMIENGKVFAGCPPLYKMTFKSGKYKGQTIYAKNEEERDKFIAKYQKEGENLSALVAERSKGLGEMSVDDFKVALDPKTREVRVITLDDIEGSKDEAAEALNLLFAKSEEAKTARRQWIDNTFETEID